ncbi:hypothetical protein Y032_0352g3273 [Ancylostoma ceylanicum]|uniref:Uncharacterized protein n=1 Tax=Ancylostoma ceylanicum TaxID=53326 RepID=A0A016RXB7_9BILA|nr:hypothetical protein Y032_0352g3273 [Ancylostoma ceylanicum]
MHGAYISGWRADAPPATTRAGDRYSGPAGALLALYVCYLEKLSKQLLDKIEDSEYWPYSLAIYESDSEDNLAKKALDSFKMYTDKVSAL